MNRYLFCLLILVTSVGCPDVDKYTPDETIDPADSGIQTPLDMAVTLPDMQPVRDMNLASDAAPVADVGAPDMTSTDASVSDATIADATIADAMTENDDGSVTDQGTGVPDTCEVVFQTRIPESMAGDRVFVAGEGFGVEVWQPALAPTISAEGPAS